MTPQALSAPFTVKLMIVVFDLDDTLYPESAYALSALNAAGRFAQAEFGWDAFAAKLTELFASGRRRELFQVAARDLGLNPPTEQQLAALLSAYREHRPISLPWYPDALEVVRTLHAQRPLALISDGYLPAQQYKAEALGLAQWIPNPIFTEALGREHWKPSPRAFELLMTRHPGQEFVYVADNPEKDFIAPRALGWKTIRVRRLEGIYAQATDAPSGSPDQVISSLQGLPAIL